MKQAKIKNGKVKAPCDFWGDALLLRATLESIHCVGRISGMAPGLLEKLVVAIDLAKRIETRIDLDLPGGCK